MTQEDRNYFERRMKVELQRAEQASLPAAARSHYQLAHGYRDKLVAAGIAK